GEHDRRVAADHPRGLVRRVGVEQVTDQTALDFSARNRVLERHQRKELCRWLEWEMYRLGSWLEHKGDGEFAARSVNDCRKLLGGLTADLRVLGGVFPPSRWVQEGWTRSIGEYTKGGNHGRKVQTFRPRAGITFTPVPRPD